MGVKKPPAACQATGINNGADVIADTSGRMAEYFCFVEH